MFFQVDPANGVAIFDQVVRQVKFAVARGAIRPGNMVPSVRELAKELAINPNTVARAYDLLESQGVIVRRQGSGCFVTGETSGLELSQRKKKLDELIQRTITEAHHLGFDKDHLRAALERRLRADLATEKKP